MKPIKGDGKSKMATALTAPREEGTAPHVIIRARAGTGKTFTLIQGIKAVLGYDPCRLIGDDGFVKYITPSPEQAAIWTMLVKDYKTVKTVGITSFSNGIVDVLKQRVPAGAKALTIHSMGYAAVRARFDGLELNDQRMQHKVLPDVLGKSYYQALKERKTFVTSLIRLTNLVKTGLVPTDISDDGEREVVHGLFRELAEAHGVELQDSIKDWSNDIFSAVPDMIARAMDVGRDKCLDYNDMIWLPCVLGLDVFKYDLFLVDEAQDLNPCQQYLAKKAGRRLVFCGDDRQTIYGFSGADRKGLDNISQELGRTKRGVVVLPMTETRRCSHSVVFHANQWVPDLKAHKDNRLGAVEHLGLDEYRNLVQYGDMVLCRVNWPLYGECLGMIVNGYAARINGKEMLSTLLNVVDTILAVLGDGGTQVFRQLMRDYFGTRQERRGGRCSERDLDTHHCLIEMLDQTGSVRGLRESLVDLNQREEGPPSQSILYSTIHRAKGMEAERVFVLAYGAGDRGPRSAGEATEEENLRYVAATRAIDRLFYVHR